MGSRAHTRWRWSYVADPAALRNSSRRSVAIELNQSLVDDPEAMRDLVEHDMSALTTALADVLQVSKQAARIRLDSESLIARD